MTNMASPACLPSTNLHEIVAGLDMHTPHSFAGKQIEQDSETSSPRDIAVDSYEQVGFLTLPREIRDQIYINLVVAADPIQYDENFETLSRNDTFNATAMMLLFEDVSNIQIAQEARETFYQHNTFLVYTHDIENFLVAKAHSMFLAAGEGVEPTVHSTPFEVGAWLRKLAVRVGWHTSDGWSDGCCQNPGQDLSTLLKSNDLRSVIIDARFGAWSYGYPQGIGWDLLKEMKEKWGKDFKIYNDQNGRQDTRRYTSDRRDLSDRWLSEDERFQYLEDVMKLETGNGQKEWVEAAGIHWVEQPEESEDEEKEQEEEEEREAA